MNKVIRRPARTFGFWDPFLSSHVVSPAKRRIHNHAFPAVNIRELDDNFLIELAVPGFKKSDFAINVEDEVLIISGKKNNSEEERNEQLIRKEFAYAKFERKFNLDGMVQNDQIDAAYKNGVLTLTLPKREEVKSVKRAIEIK